MRAAIVTALTVSMLLGVPGASVAQEEQELSTTDRLDQRRYVAAGDEAYVMGFQDGSFQAQGWHVTGEMGGVWSQPLKLVDGVWFGVDGDWVGPATKFTSGWGYVGMDLPDHRRPEALARRLRAGWAARRVDRPSDGEPRRRAHGERHGRRPLRGDEPLPVGLDDAERRRLQPRRQRGLHGRRARVPRHGYAAPECRRTRLGRAGRVRPRRPSGASPSPGHWGSQGPPRAVHRRGPVHLRRRAVRQGHGRAAALRGDDPGGRGALAVDRRGGLRPGRIGRARRARGRAGRPRRPAGRQAGVQDAMVGLHARVAARRSAPRQGDRLGQAEPARLGPGGERPPGP